MMTLTPKEKAAAGFWLVRQAVLDLLKEHPGGLKATPIKDALGFWSKNLEKPGLVMPLLHLMVADGELVTLPGGHPTQPTYCLASKSAYA